MLLYIELKKNKVIIKALFSGNRLDANQYLRSRKVKELIAHCQKHTQTGEAVDIGQATFYTSLSLLSNTIFSRDFANPYVNSGESFSPIRNLYAGKKT